MSIVKNSCTSMAAFASLALFAGIEITTDRTNAMYRRGEYYRLLGKWLHEER